MDSVKGTEPIRSNPHTELCWSHWLRLQSLQCQEASQQTLQSPDLNWWGNPLQGEMPCVCLKFHTHTPHILFLSGWHVIYKQDSNEDTCIHNSIWTCYFQALQTLSLLKRQAAFKTNSDFFLQQWGNLRQRALLWLCAYMSSDIAKGGQGSNCPRCHAWGCQRGVFLKSAVVFPRAQS